LSAPKVFPAAPLPTHPSGHISAAATTGFFARFFNDFAGLLDGFSAGYQHFSALFPAAVPTTAQSAQNIFFSKATFTIDT
jgi:hypothetical protein